MTRRRYATQLSSGQHVTRLKPKEVNKRPCPVCKAKEGETCFRLTATSFIELNETHATVLRKKNR